METKYFITGGAGFIGSNYVHRLLAQNKDVTIFDNLCRAGAKRNIQWLKDSHGEQAFRLIIGDVRDYELVKSSIIDADVIVHLAGQVAVTTSVLNPKEDFEINAGGTINVLEGARLGGKKPIFLYASTNKVYGEMEDIKTVEGDSRWSYQDLPMGCSEEQPLDFHSPYGCSKGAGDQYVRDYARIYGLRSLVFRQSCIYGPRQFGVEDQGWLAWMIIAAVTGRQISIYGDGKQVRDILHVDDLLNAYDAAIDKIDLIQGQVFNIGGGPNNVISIWKECGPLLEKLLGSSIPVNQADWRPGDQKVFVADIRKAEKRLGWKPKINAREGVELLFRWVSENRDIFFK